MVRFKAVSGDLYVGESAENAKHIESEMADVLYNQAVFISDDIEIRFYAGIGGYIPVEESNIDNEYGDNIYYPFSNETVAEIAINPGQDLTLFKENVGLLYAMVEGDMYIASQSDIGTPYFVQEDQIYKILDPMITPPQESFNGDKFLNVASVEEPVNVKNVASKVTAPVDVDTVEEVLERDKNGALKVREPDAVLTQAFNKLRQN